MKALFEESLRSAGGRHGEGGWNDMHGECPQRPAVSPGQSHPSSPCRGRVDEHSLLTKQLR